MTCSPPGVECYVEGSRNRGRKEGEDHKVHEARTKRSEYREFLINNLQNNHRCIVNLHVAGRVFGGMEIQEVNEYVLVVKDKDDRPRVFDYDAIDVIEEIV